jgi:predicted DNA-binding transcriptional regulator YafY
LGPQKTMAINKLALIRYKTIDECLKNKFRKWTLEDLMEKVANALYEYEGITSGISRRTIQGDIQLMRSDKLGYNAPIVVMERKFYMYKDASYSITKMPINHNDLEKMREIVSVLKHMNGFNYFDEMSEMITKLENNLNKTTSKTRNFIQFEGNMQLKGLQHISPLYQSILNKRSLLIEYKSFKALKSQKDIYYPYLLKEYRNRWFLICKAKKGRVLLTLALDRILEVHEVSGEVFVEYNGVDFDRYYNDLIGVTKSENERPHKVILHVNASNAPYVLTKPIHASQQVLKEDTSGIVIRLDVILNFELEREILGFGEHIKVIAPRLLCSRIQKRMQKAITLYDTGTSS